MPKIYTSRIESCKGRDVLIVDIDFNRDKMAIADDLGPTLFTRDDSDDEMLGIYPRARARKLAYDALLRYLKFLCNTVDTMPTVLTQIHDHPQLGLLLLDRFYFDRLMAGQLQMVWFFYNYTDYQIEVLCYPTVQTLLEAEVCRISQVMYLNTGSLKVAEAYLPDLLSRKIRFNDLFGLSEDQQALLLLPVIQDHVLHKNTFSFTQAKNISLWVKHLIEVDPFYQKVVAEMDKPLLHRLQVLTYKDFQFLKEASTRQLLQAGTYSVREILRLTARQRAALNAPPAEEKKQYEACRLFAEGGSASAPPTSALRM